MKPHTFARALICAVILLTASAFNIHAGIFKNWTNSAGGNYFDPFSWSPNGVPQADDAVTITNNGTYTVLASTGIVSTAVFTIGGGSGKQTFIYGTGTAFTKLGLTNSTVLANGVLAVTNQGAFGAVTIKSGGELQLNSGAGMQLYSFSITNEGTITWLNGSLAVGGNSGETTFITNSGLFQIFGDNALNFGGGDHPLLFNAGVIRKFTGSATTAFGMDLINLPSGLVDVLAGTIQFSPTGSNILGGSFTATSPGQIKFFSTHVDAGGSASGSGTIQDVGGNFYLRTNVVPGIKLTGCDIYITGATTFQNAGIITNLTLDGAVLHGTNRVSGTLTVNSGALVDTLTVLPGGQLAVMGTLGTQFYSLNLFNQGTFSWSGGSISVGNTIISNGGIWNITGDANVSYGGGNTPCLTNSGTIQKTGGTGTSGFVGVAFVNTPVGIVRASSGTLQMPYNYTNVAGELQLAGGTFTATPGTLYMSGGNLDGSGTIGSPAEFDGGVVQPGPLAGLMRFQSSLVLGTNCTLMLDGTGTVPGVSYDQLSVTGAVSISNCTLQVSWPKVPGGTRFVIITNNSATPVAGTFNGLPENSPLTITGQPYHIHYSGGSGNDVVLMRDLPGGPLLSSGGFSNKTYRLSGLGNNPATIYAIQATTNFVQWTNIGKATGDINGDFNFVDTNAASFNRRFYRTTN